MSVILIDEGVILRYVLNDHPKQSKQAARVIATGNAHAYPLTFARAAVVLRDVYHVPRSLIGETLSIFLDEVCVIEKDVVRYALRLFAKTTYDFTDCLLIARNALYGHEVFSFDKPLLRELL